MFRVHFENFITLVDTYLRGQVTFKCKSFFFFSCTFSCSLKLLLLSVYDGLMNKLYLVLINQKLETDTAKEAAICSKIN